jgi:stress-induced-phosphoprotein 1
VTDLKPDWPRGWSRAGAAHVGLGQWAEAVEAYDKGLALDPTSEAMAAARADAAARLAGGGGGGGGGKGAGLFGPAFLARLAASPATSRLLADPEFRGMLAAVEADPASMNRYLGDDRFQAALAVGLGVSVRPGGGEGGGGEEGGGEEASTAPPPPPPEPAAPAEPPPPPPPLTPEQEAAAAARAAAQAAKEEGNAAYKSKKFDEAIAAYTKAMELDPTDITFLTNRAAARLEAGDTDGAIADCEAAVEKGRQVRADFAAIAKALARKGAALVKAGRLEEGVEAYQKSLTEHRSADTLKRLGAAEKALKAAREAAYVDVGLAEQERAAGNEAFAAGDFPAAVKRYSEALARGPPGVYPDAHKLLSNRAACYTKLGALAEGLKDADTCIGLAPTWAKGYSRKGALQFLAREYDKALATYQTGLAADPESAELKEGAARCLAALERQARGADGESAEELAARQARAMADPEVQGILTDPVMRQVLQDMQDDPAAAARHAAQPAIMAKIRKLAAAGLVRLA